MICKEPLHALLREGKCTADISLEALLELFPRLLQKRFLARILDAVDGQLEFQAFEAAMCLDVLKGILQRCLRCVRRECFEYRVGTPIPDF